MISEDLHGETTEINCIGVSNFAIAILSYICSFVISGFAGLSAVCSFEGRDRLVWIERICLVVSNAELS